jgi:hypothetical protein
MPLIYLLGWAAMLTASAEAVWAAINITAWFSGFAAVLIILSIVYVPAVLCPGEG